MEEELFAKQTGVKDARAAREVQWKPNEELPRQPKVGKMVSEPKPKKPPPPPPKTDVLRFGSGSRTKVLTGRGMIDKARREAREMAHFKPGHGNLSVPSHKLRMGIVTKAPTKYQPPRPTGVSQRPTASVNALRLDKPIQALGPSPLSLEEKERRLRELTARRHAAEKRDISSSPPSDYSSPEITTPASSPPPPTIRTLTQNHVKREGNPGNKPQAPFVKERPPSTTHTNVKKEPNPSSKSSAPLIEKEAQVDSVRNIASTYIKREPGLEVKPQTALTDKSPTLVHMKRESSPGMKPLAPSIKKRAPADPMMPAKRRKVA